MIIEEKYELFDAYLENSMSVDEKISFELMLSDIAIKNEFDEYCQITNAYTSITKNENAENEFKQNLKSIAANYNANSKEETFEEYAKAQNAKRDILKPKAKLNIFTIHRNVKFIAVAAIMVIGFFASKLLFNTPKESMQNLYASNFSIEPLSLERGGAQDSLYQIAMLFNAKNYDSTIPLITKYLTTHTQETKLNVVMAMCKMEKNNFAEAENILQDVIKQNNTYKEKAQWYLAMLFLKQNNKSKVLEVIKSFDTSHFYYAKGQDILKKI
jgi:tetratricopeptide (TPR) repeat protein